MASHDALLTSVGMTTVFGVCPCSCRAFCHGSAYPNSRARSSGLLKHNVGSAILESFRGIMGAACQMFLLGWHCRARAGRVLCNPVVLCSPVQSSVLFVPTERPPPSPSQLTPHTAHSDGPKPLSFGGKLAASVEHSVSLLSLQSCCAFFHF